MFSTNATTTKTFSVSSFISKVYLWMMAGLALTSSTAYLVYSNTNLFMAIITNKPIFYGLLIAQLIMVIILSSQIKKMSFELAVFMFFIYAALLGTILSVFFYVYEITSIFKVLGITTGTFGIMALYGHFTKSDLTSVGNILNMGLFGLILALVVNIFLGSAIFDIVISFAGIFIFTGLTAYNAQKIKDLRYLMYQQGYSENKIALLGALTLYLDFVNLFIYILRLLGRRK